MKSVYLVVTFFLLYVSTSSYAATVVPKPPLIEPVKKIVEGKHSDYRDRQLSCAIDAEGLKCWGKFHYTHTVPIFQANVTDFLFFLYDYNVCYYGKDEVLKCGWIATSAVTPLPLTTIGFKFTNISSLQRLGDSNEIICVDDFFMNRKRRSCFAPHHYYKDSYPNPPPNGYPEFYYTEYIQSQFVENEEDNSKVKFNACALNILNIPAHDWNYNFYLDKWLNPRGFIIDKQSPLKITHTAKKTDRFRRPPSAAPERIYSLTSYFELPQSYSNTEVKINTQSKHSSFVVTEDHGAATFYRQFFYMLGYLPLPEWDCLNKKVLMHEIRPRMNFNSDPRNLGEDTALEDHDLRFKRTDGYAYRPEYVFTGLDGSNNVYFDTGRGFGRIRSFRNFHTLIKNETVEIYDRNWKMITKTYRGQWARRFSAGGKLYSCWDDRCYSVKVE